MHDCAQAENKFAARPQAVTQGDTFGAGYAGSGVAVGTNGVVIYEHSGRYFVPIPSFATPSKVGRTSPSLCGPANPTPTSMAIFTALKAR